MSPEADNQFQAFSEFQSASAGVQAFQIGSGNGGDLRAQPENVDKAANGQVASPSAKEIKEIVQSTAEKHPDEFSKFKENATEQPAAEKEITDKAEEKDEKENPEQEDASPEEEDPALEVSKGMVRSGTDKKKERVAEEAGLDEKLESGMKEQSQRLKKRVADVALKGREETEFEKEGAQPLLTGEVKKRAGILRDEDEAPVEKYTPKRPSKFSETVEALEQVVTDHDPKVYQDRMQKLLEARATARFCKKQSLGKPDQNQEVHSLVQQFSRGTERNREEILSHIELVKEAATHIHPPERKIKKEKSEALSSYGNLLSQLGIRR